MSQFCTRLYQNYSKFFKQGANKNAILSEPVNHKQILIPGCSEVPSGSGRVTSQYQYGKENKLHHLYVFALMKCTAIAKNQKKIKAEVVAGIPVFHSFQTQTIVDEKLFFYFYLNFSEFDYELLKSTLKCYSNVKLIIYTGEGMLLFRRNNGVWDAFDHSSHITLSSNCVLADFVRSTTCDGLGYSSSSGLTYLNATEKMNYAKKSPVRQAKLKLPRSGYGFRPNGNMYLVMPSRSYSSTVKEIPTKDSTKIDLSRKSYQAPSGLSTRLNGSLRNFLQKFSNTSYPMQLEFTFRFQNDPSALQLRTLLPFFSKNSAGTMKIMMVKYKIKDSKRRGIVCPRVKIIDGKRSVNREIDINRVTYRNKPKAITSSLGYRYRELSKAGIERMVVIVSGQPNPDQQLALWEFITTYSSGENMVVVLQMSE